MESTGKPDDGLDAVAPEAFGNDDQLGQRKGVIPNCYNN
jgi:hypothetical protein